MLQNLRGMSAVLIAAVLWSTGGLFVKKIPLDPLTIVCIRSAIAGITLLPFLNIKKISFNKYLLGYIIGFTWLVITFVSATKLTSAANAIVLQYTAPLYLFICGVFKGDIKANIRAVIPMVLIFLGICSFFFEPNTGSNIIGNLLGVSSGVALTLMSVFLHKLRETPAVGLVCFANLSASLLLLPFLPDYSAIAGINLEGWLALIYLGIFQIGLANVFYARGLKKVKPLQATVLSLTEAVLNPVWVAVFIGEIPSPYGLAGALFILSAVLLDSYIKINEEKKTQILAE